ncbi:MAG: GNAT family N-acetyltransferase [Candidatus Neomarinimicrobiota bacterium]
MAVKIIEVQTRKELKQFVRFPLKLYRGNPYYVPLLDFDEMNTLDARKNPAFEFCEARYWLAYKDEKLAGRIAGIYNKRYVEIYGKKSLRFGWIDFIDDEKVAGELLSAVEKWARELGADSIHGPLGFTDLDREGMLIDGFQEIGTLASIYNYPYYPQYIEKFGYEKDAEWIEFEITPPKVIPTKVRDISQVVKKRLSLHTLEIKKTKEVLPYAHQLFEVYNSTYNVLYGFVPLTEKQIEAYIKQYIGFMDPDHIAIVLDKNDRLVGFGLTMPSLSRALQKAGGRLFPFGLLHLLWALKHNKKVELLIVGVLPEYQGQGVPALMIAELAEKFAKKGIVKAESNPELITNSKVQAQWKFFDLRQHKRRRCFIKHL